MGGAPRIRDLRRPFLAAACLAGAVFGPTTPLAGQLTQEEALALAFPDADAVERRSAFLTDDQRAAAAARAGEAAPLETGIVTYYVGRRNGRDLGVAYFDAHRVRTLQEVLMVVVDPGGGVVRVETVVFREPPEYEAPGRWLELMHGRRLDESLSLKGEIPNLTGATLTAGAAVGAVRRVLALHGVIRPLPSPEGGP